MFNIKTNINIGGAYAVATILGMVLTFVCIAIGGIIPLIGAAISMIVSACSMFAFIVNVVNNLPEKE
jgi:hypothetical protein